MRVFVICPVRGLTETEKTAIEKYVSDLEKNGHTVHWPPRDTDQDDAVGLRICRDNLRAIESADEIHVWWNGNSQGSLFDFGMTFASKKKIILINKGMVEKTVMKSFNNVLLELDATREARPEKPPLTPEQLKGVLQSICDRETSQDPNDWTPENPLWGHCAVVSLVAQNLFGGELLRASLAETKGFEHMRSHYWNKLADGSEEDFTKSQFGACYPTQLKAETRDRSYVLSYPETAKRYKLLAFRLAKALSGNNPIFEDAIYQQCFYAALDSPCQKMKFGCLLMRNGKEVCVSNNHFIEPLKSLCEPKCIRLSLASRTESMLGACGHAEEFVMWEAISKGIPLNECDLYIAGIYPNGLPWLKKEAADHTCLRCSVQMYYAGLRTIFVPFVDRWVGLSKERSIAGSLAYATKEKKV